MKVLKVQNQDNQRERNDAYLPNIFFPSLVLRSANALLACDKASPHPPITILFYALGAKIWFFFSIHIVSTNHTDFPTALFFNAHHQTDDALNSVEASLDFNF
jgi:hypothetical protein